ncbi:GNAT family N-acetyltransferase [Streptomyces sp. NPDC005438]|uniref:GNAT family N-acetyltransferase n=1 Tax=Streptomyces sp. NPDC005438 TaxID=3156880 RepID=UPI0033B0E9A4
MHPNTERLTIRPLTGREELPLFQRLPYELDHELGGDLASGRRHPEWLWLALSGGRVLAKLAWWSTPHHEGPLLLDVLEVDDTLPAPDRLRVGLRLLRAATATVLPAGASPPEYTRFVPADWREDPARREVVRTRMTLLEHAGARPLVERSRWEWRPGTPVAEPDGRLRFRQVLGEAELLDLMTRVLEGTLDAHSRAELASRSPRETALSHYEEELARYASPRAWWRTATLPDGEPVGFVVPAHNGYNATIAYIGVLPEHRGHGHVDRLLAEGTRVLAEQDVPRVRAATDLGNVPMARAFHRAGYVSFQHEVTMTWG